MVRIAAEEYSPIERIELGDLPMMSDEQKHVAMTARAIYKNRLRESLEQSHRDEFVAIEPTSGDFFLGPTLTAAIGAARVKHPERLVHTLRVGHRAAIHFGLQIR